MPTPSNPPPAGDWAPRTAVPKRSVFGNYRPEPSPAPGLGAGPVDRSPQLPGCQSAPAGVGVALARAFVLRFLAKAYEDPSAEGWAWLCDSSAHETLRKAWETAVPGESFDLAFDPNDLPEFHNAYLAAFGHAARGTCPLNEIEYGDLKADPLFQPHRLADLGAFYRAFGVEVAEDAGERHDHLCLELEFLCVLAAKEAYALEHGCSGEALELCRDAQKQFLREHLGRWVPAFARRLAATTSHPALQALAVFTGKVLQHECARFGVPPGSHDLALRPADEAADRMCESCGIAGSVPGALPVS